MARAAADFPTEHRGDAVQAHHANSEDCVECFEHQKLLISSRVRKWNRSGRGACPRCWKGGGKPPFLTCSIVQVFESSLPALCVRSQSSSSSSESSPPLNILSDQRRLSNPM